jgi:hypothetical protein
MKNVEIEQFSTNAKKKKAGKRRISRQGPARHHGDCIGIILFA